MGKTSFCINYYDHLRKKFPNIDVILLSLVQIDALKSLTSVKRPSDSIVILDALDEDPAAIQDGQSRIYEVLQATANFKAVIITCRSQFFPNDAAIPTETGVSIVTPRMAGQNTSYKLYRLYLAPFNEKQISRFIRSHFPFMNPFVALRRSQAYSFVKDVKELAARPMLLELLPLLVKDQRKAREIYDLYEFMITKWLERESSWIPSERLMAVSLELAVHIHTQHVGGSGDRVTLKDLEAICYSLSGERGTWDHLTTRSLLNRDSNGKLKFAHRSIMEFLFVVAAIGGDARCLEVKWTDFMKQIFISWGYTEAGKRDLVSAEKILTSDLIATSLLPLSEPPIRPTITSAPDFEAAAARRNAGKGAHRSASGQWRRKSIRISRNTPGMISIQDVEFNLQWYIQDRNYWATEGLISEYRRPVAEIQKLFSGDSEFRLPSYAEFITLVEGASAIGREDMVSDGELYILGDMLGEKRYLAVMLGNGLTELGKMITVDKERAISFTKRRVTAYEFGIYADASAFRHLRTVGLGVKSGIT